MSEQRTPKMTGGCQCGAVRYALYARPDRVGICHCRMCQKAVGGPFFAWAAVSDSDIAWTRGKPAVFSSSSAADRGFCAHCGTPLIYERARSPHMVNIPRALFAERTGRQPLYHIAIEELQQWAYTGEPLVPLKGFPGVVWQRSKKKRRSAGDDPFELSREDA